MLTAQRIQPYLNESAPMKTIPSTPKTPTEFLTTEGLRVRWQVSAMFLWRLRRSGKLHAFRFSNSRSVRYSLAEIERIEREAQA